MDRHVNFQIPGILFVKNTCTSLKHIFLVLSGCVQCVLEWDA